MILRLKLPKEIKGVCAAIGSTNGDTVLLTEETISALQSWLCAQKKAAQRSTN